MRLVGTVGGQADADLSVRYVAASLIFGVFFGGLSGGVAFPTLPRLGPILGISPFVVGIILSANRFTRLVCNAPAGSILDTIGTRRPMIAGFCLQGLAPFGYVLALNAGRLGFDSATVFLAARAVWGIGSAFVFVGAFATITHVTTPENRGRWVGYMRGGQSLGFPAGLVLGGLLADAYGFTVAFVAAGCAGLFAAGVAALVLPDLDPDVDRTGSLREIPTIVRGDPRIASVGTNARKPNPTPSTPSAGTAINARLARRSEYRPTATVVTLAPRTASAITTPLTPVSESAPIAIPFSAA